MKKNVRVSITPNGTIHLTGRMKYLNLLMSHARTQAACMPDAVAEWGRNFESLANHPESEDVPEVLKQPTEPEMIPPQQYFAGSMEKWLNGGVAPEQPTTERLGEHLWGYLTDNYPEWETVADDFGDELAAELKLSLGGGVQVMLDTYGSNTAELATLRAKVAELQAGLENEVNENAKIRAGLRLEYSQQIDSGDVEIGKLRARVKEVLSDANAYLARVGELERQSAAHLAEGKRIEAVWEARQVQWDAQKANLVAEIEAQRVELAALKARPELDPEPVVKAYRDALHQRHSGYYEWDKIGPTERALHVQSIAEALAQFAPPALTSAERAELEAYRNEPPNPLKGMRRAESPQFGKHYTVVGGGKMDGRWVTTNQVKLLFEGFEYIVPDTSLYEPIPTDTDNA